MQELAKTLMLFGLILLGVGGFIFLFGRLPFLGKLPGDFLIQRENFTFYFPLTTMVVISLLLSVLANLFFRR